MVFVKKETGFPPPVEEGGAEEGLVGHGPEHHVPPHRVPDLLVCVGWAQAIPTEDRRGTEGKGEVCGSANPPPRAWVEGTLSLKMGPWL